MPDDPTPPAPPTETTGVARTSDGTIADNSSSTPPTTTPPPTPAGTTLLTEPPKEGDPPKSEPKAGAPEKYADYKVPDNYTLDPEVKTKADAIFRDLGLSQESAQRLVDFYTDTSRETLEAPFAAWKDMNDKWREASSAHPDLKGKIGPGGEVNVRISRALDAIGDPTLVTEFKQLMDLTGAGNHPAFIRVIDRWAKQVTEGTPVGGRGPTEASQSRPGQAPPSAAQAMYPHLPSKT